MRRIISSLLRSVFTKKTITALVVVAIYSLLFAASTVASGVPGTSDKLTRDPMASETGLGPAPFFNYQGPGANFIKAGVTTRVTNNAWPVQTEPFDLTVPALPSGAVVVETFISWNYLLYGVPPPGSDDITVNHNSVTGTLVGTGTPDLCWGVNGPRKDGTASYMASGVTSFINPGPASVIVTIGGATDKRVGADPNAFGEGLTILVVYEVPNHQLRNVDLYCGLTSTESGPVPLIAAATLNYTVPYRRGDFHFFVNALDGQEYVDSFFIDGISRGGQVIGTVRANNAWNGLLGPATSNNVYDHANDNISAILTRPDVSLDISTHRIVGGDCVGHSFAAVSFPLEYVPEYSKMHWPQLPDRDNTGMDVDMSALSQIPLADDWECTETGPVTDIHFWASFWYDLLPIHGAGSLEFAVSIYANIPGPPYSMPGTNLWNRVFYPGQYNVYQVADDKLEDWYNPVTGTWLDDNHLHVYQYDLFIYDDFFVQDSGTIYWLEVKDLSEQSDILIGWKTTEHDLHFMDNAVYGDPALGGWSPMFYPQGHEYEDEPIDLAFVITGGPVPECGDVNNDGIVDAADMVYLASYLFRGGPPPVPQSCVGDINNDDIVDIRDIVYWINYIFWGGPAPDPNCCKPPWR